MVTDCITISEQEQVLKNRQKYNNILLRILKKYLRDNPTFRFAQVLKLLTFVSTSDNWGEEPEVTYRRVSRILEQQKIMRDRIYGDDLNVRQNDNNGEDKIKTDNQ